MQIGGWGIGGDRASLRRLKRDGNEAPDRTEFELRAGNVAECGRNRSACSSHGAAAGNLVHPVSIERDVRACETLFTFGIRRSRRASMPFVTSLSDLFC